MFRQVSPASGTYLSRLKKNIITVNAENINWTEQYAKI